MLAACVALEGAALVVLGLLVLASVVAGGGGNVGLFLSLVLLFGLYGGVLLLAARAMLHRRRWARSLGILSQLIALLMAPTVLGAGVWAAGVPMLVVAAVALVLVLLPQVGGRLDDGARP
ncbi:hypothetical protein CLV35_2842 [Motilibacter peucedani]|uniref:Uncharacterized protein n=1 Tax=Motilibacter peucedani TaxID=598650 RepID=A0A420XMU6_9ACTN|nr:hypothetical protein CLV35_2842 [Motilibacter peucedani]